MKHCPTCGSSYTDDTLVFCLQDGATLEGVKDIANPLSMVATLRGDSQRGQDEATQVINDISAPTVEIPASALPTAVYQERRSTASVTGHAAPTIAQPANTTRVIFITVGITALLLGLGSIGAWMLFRGHGDGGGRERREAEVNSNASGNDRSGATNTSNAARADNQARVADRPDKGGRWFVILGSFPKDEIDKATERMDSVRRQGFDARIVSSDDYPNFKSGLWIIVMGPYTRNNAEEILGQVRPKVKDAYTKSGW